MKKSKVILPLIGSFLMGLAGCEPKNSHIIVNCDHVYNYQSIDRTFHKLVCSKCGLTLDNSKEMHDIDESTNTCKLCSYKVNDDVEVGYPCSKHTWSEKVIIKEATCTEKGYSQRTCIVCGEKEEQKTIKALGHDFIDYAEGNNIAPTCTERGVKEQVCQRCGLLERVEVEALGHNWVDDRTGGVQATCTVSGSKNQHCTRCDARETVEVPALGHDYDDWTLAEGKGPTCTEKGEECRSCLRCGEEEKREVEPTGHHFELVGADTPVSPETVLRIYQCSNGCGETFLGFKATDVTDRSKQHLTMTKNDAGETGVSFWGRSIGNAMALDADGYSIKQLNNECVYCSTEEGDYFEYIFNLTADQAEVLSTCKLYCDARPASYLSGDFWAYNANNTDWTPGYYIDGSEEHIEHDEYGNPVMVYDHAKAVGSAAGDELETMVPMGKRVEKYRYVLYVDDIVRDFDESIQVPVEGRGTNMVRKEYELPYTFHLHPGENKIRLHMAGGYKSTFYNFVFRAVEEPSLTFKSTDVTNDSKATLSYTLPDANGEVGASYKGRPIGNALALNTEVIPYISINQIYNELVYCSTEKGSYYEFVFNLNAQEAETYSNCMLYCDAKPSEYLAYNNDDFWKYGKSTLDWTTGYYIDGSDEHVEHDESGNPILVYDHAKAVENNPGEQLSTAVPLGKRVIDYRYVLYVDGSAVDFDSSINVPTEVVRVSGTRETLRREYIMPYKFHLHEGENRISLHMAGHYISTFYNFTFRPC